MNDRTFYFWLDLFALILAGSFAAALALCVIGSLVCIAIGALQGAL